MTDLKLPKTLQTKAVRGFFYAGKMVKVGDAIELPYPFAREMMASGKVECKDWPPPPGPDIVDKSVPAVPSAATAKEAENAKKQDAARSAEDKATIKDEADAEKRSKP